MGLLLQDLTRGYKQCVNQDWGLFESLLGEETSSHWLETNYICCNQACLIAVSKLHSRFNIPLFSNTFLNTYYVLEGHVLNLFCQLDMERLFQLLAHDTTFQIFLITWSLSKASPHHKQSFHHSPDDSNFTFENK